MYKTSWVMVALVGLACSCGGRAVPGEGQQKTAPPKSKVSPTPSPPSTTPTPTPRPSPPPSDPPPDPADPPPATATETVTCTFDGSSTQECYSADLSSWVSCKGVGSCQVLVTAPYGTKITWKSSCGGYAYTVVDGTDEKAPFSCL